MSCKPDTESHLVCAKCNKPEDPDRVVGDACLDCGWKAWERREIQRQGTLAVEREQRRSVLAQTFGLLAPRGRRP